ncbi:MAG TPA: TIGR03986 family CRISPR-associated RAMP protein [Chloroflexi bacterium]|nr:TIGR03986 family CRISPR-associated RAMP protein [Chloroflexota bacterium]
MTKKNKGGGLSWRKIKREKEKRERQEQVQHGRRVQEKTPPPEVIEAPPSPRHSWPAPRPSTERPESYRFLNPYNFVRYLSEPQVAPGDTDAQVLWRCPPPPHDRYVGLTGRITCTLETVTPLFIADSHDVKATPVAGRSDEQKHLSYRFFQYEGHDAIPATSLRGMIRSLFELVTNAPFTVFDSDERLEYRLDPNEARHLKAGIVRSLPDGDEPGEIALCDSAKVGAYYDNEALNILDDSWRCGDVAYAIIGRSKNNLPKVEVLARDPATIAHAGTPVQGWLKITGRTIDTKKNEQIFYFKGDPDKAKRVSFDQARQADYNTVLAAQRERKEDFRSQVQTWTLTLGDLVYVDLEPDNKRVRHIALVKVARLRYRKAIGALLCDHLKPSTQYEELDVASRLFGWVREAHRRGRRGGNLDEKMAYAGRVRFSHATLTEEGDKGVYDQPMTLAILGEPKPTTSLFYLRKKEGEWSVEERTVTNAAMTVGYDGNNLLRGRKIYRHHGRALNRQEYERVRDEQTGELIRDHQNRTVHSVRVPGNQFQFTVDFHNLAPVELGALLWVLDLSQTEVVHLRLGYAKPLGFGSVKLIVEDVHLLDIQTRYQSLANTGWKRARVRQRGAWLLRFETAMERAYGKALRDLDNIQDLLNLLREPIEALPSHIHYPRSATRPDPAGKNFVWFEVNKKKARRPEDVGPNHVLPEPSAEREGFPLLGSSAP